MKKKTGVRTGSRTRSFSRSLLLRLKRRDKVIAGVVLAAGLTVAAVALVAAWPYWRLAGRFEPLPTVEPSRLYGRPLRLQPGLALAAERLAERLVELSYHPAGERGLLPGTFHAAADRVTIARRRFRAQVADEGGGLLVCDFRGDRLVALELEGQAVAEAYLDPPLVATYYGPDLLERRPTPLAEIPGDVARAVLAAEDAGFFEHPGISATGVAARALDQRRRRRGAPGRLDRHPAARQEPLPDLRAHRRAQAARGDARADARVALLEGADPRGLPQPDLLGTQRRGQPDRRRRGRRGPTSASARRSSTSPRGRCWRR